MCSWSRSIAVSVSAWCAALTDSTGAGGRRGRRWRRGSGDDETLVERLDGRFEVGLGAIGCVESLAQRGELGTEFVECRIAGSAWLGVGGGPTVERGLRRRWWVGGLPAKQSHRPRLHGTARRWAEGGSQGTVRSSGLTEQLAAAATGCTFEPAGRRVMKGFAEPVSVRALVTHGGPRLIDQA